MINNLLKQRMSKHLCESNVRITALFYISTMVPTMLALNEPVWIFCISDGTTFLRTQKDSEIKTYKVTFDIVI